MSSRVIGVQSGRSTCGDLRDAGRIRLLVTGATGQLGRELLRSAQADGISVIGFSHADLDVTDRAAVREAVREVKRSTGRSDRAQASGGLSAVIHAAAYTRVDAAESDKETAFRVNRNGAAHVAEAAAEVGVPIIHFSTDYVFSGESERPWREDDPTGPRNVYGASKLAGELAVAERHPQHIILRTSWLFGASGANFVRALLRSAREVEEVRVVTDQRGGPTPTVDLADATVAIVRAIVTWKDGERGCALPSTWGIYHLAGIPPVTWFEFAQEVFEASANVRGEPHSRLVPIDSTELGLPARRPKMSVLDCSKVQLVFGTKPPDWRKTLFHVVRAIESST